MNSPVWTLIHMVQIIQLPKPFFLIYKTENMLLNGLFIYIKSMKIHLIFTDSLKGSVEKLQFLLVDGFIFFNPRSCPFC